MLKLRKIIPKAMFIVILANKHVFLYQNFLALFFIKKIVIIISNILLSLKLLIFYAIILVFRYKSLDFLSNLAILYLSQYLT